MISKGTAPPERFNFAQSVLERNAARGAKTAFVDAGRSGDTALAGALQAFVKDQLAPRDSLPAGTSEDGHWQDPALQAARARGGLIHYPL
jgi:hypothetical protein